MKITISLNSNTKNWTMFARYGEEELEVVGGLEFCIREMEIFVKKYLPEF